MNRELTAQARGPGFWLASFQATPRSLSMATHSNLHTSNSFTEHQIYCFRLSCLSGNKHMFADKRQNKVKSWCVVARNLPCSQTTPRFHLVTMMAVSSLLLTQFSSVDCTEMFSNMIPTAMGWAGSTSLSS